MHTKVSYTQLNAQNKRMGEAKLDKNEVKASYRVNCPEEHKSLIKYFH